MSTTTPETITTDTITTDDAIITETGVTPTTSNTPATTTRRSSTPSKNVTTWSVIKGEWIKFWSVRSTKYTLIAAGIATVVFGMIFSAVADSDEATGPAALLTGPVELALSGIGITEMIVGVLGVMIVAGEYSTGLIRTWFAAAGNRWRVIAAKVAVLASAVFAMGLVSSTLAIVAGQAVYAGSEPTVPLSETLDVILGTSVYLVGIALIGIALGFLLRSTAAGIGTLVGGVFIGPNLLNLLPESVTDVFMKYLPNFAGDAMMTQVADPDLLSTGAAYGVFAAWVVGLLVLAGVMVRRRDA
ncbi:MAG: hypothetical protein AAF945_15260 [Actinomycetota bacterium]